MVEKKKLESGKVEIIVSLKDGRLSVTSGLSVLIKREMFEGEWNDLWAVLNGDEKK
mgnify:CR=1 FL=1